MEITGIFDVKMAPKSSEFQGKDGMTMAAMSLRKTFHGELNASSEGEMLSIMTQVQGSAGYVAIEQVTGKLCGKAGSFVLQHFGIMDKGSDRLILEVVPDSGTGELTGLAGTMAIDIEDGKHIYTFEYRLAP